jgi:hypothetical protein
MNDTPKRLTVEDVLSIVEQRLQANACTSFWGSITVRVENGKPTVVDIHQTYKTKEQLVAE